MWSFVVWARRGRCPRPMRASPGVFGAKRTGECIDFNITLEVAVHLGFPLLRTGTLVLSRSR